MIGGSFTVPAKRIILSAKIKFYSKCLVDWSERLKCLALDLLYRHLP